MTTVIASASSYGSVIASPVLASAATDIASSQGLGSPYVVTSHSVSQLSESSAVVTPFELISQDFISAIQLSSDFSGQINASETFAGEVSLSLKAPPTLSSTARRNIVLKLREDLYGEIRIDDFTSEVTQVEGTTDFRGVLTEDQVSSTPSVFVMRLRTQATGNANLGYDVRQQVEDYFGILLVADNITDEYGVNSMDIIWAMHTKIIDSLLGWQLPATEFDRPTMPLVYRGGVAYGLELDSYHWLDQFSCTSQICSYRNRIQSATF